MLHEITLTEQQQRQKLEELIHIVNNMRFYQKYWHQHFGSAARQNKDKWEQRADKFLREAGLTEHDNIKTIQVIRK